MRWTTLFAILKSAINKVDSKVDEVKKVTNWLGVTTTAISDGSTTNPITVNGQSVTAQEGDAVAYNSVQYIFSGEIWQRFAGSILELTQAEYNALTQEEKMNGTLYLITDAYSNGFIPSDGNTLDLLKTDIKRTAGGSNYYAQLELNAQTNNSAYAKIQANNNNVSSVAACSSDGLALYSTMQGGQSGNSTIYLAPSGSVNVNATGSITVNTNGAANITASSSRFNITNDFIISTTSGKAHYTTGTPTADTEIATIQNVNTVLNTFHPNSVCRSTINILNSDAPAPYNTGKYTIAQILSKIQSGFTNNDIMIGDLIVVSITTEIGGTEIVALQVAGINSFTGQLGVLDGQTYEYEHRNHIALVPTNAFQTASAMNTTDTAAGGYYESDVHNNVMSQYATAFEQVFGADHLFMPRNYICSNTLFDPDDDGYNHFYEQGSTLAEEVGLNISNNGKLQLLTETEVFGQRVNNLSVGGCNANGLRQQLPLFRFKPELITCGLGQLINPFKEDYWLQDVAGEEYFSVVSSQGECYRRTASTELGIRPIMYIG